MDKEAFPIIDRTPPIEERLLRPVKLLRLGLLPVEIRPILKLPGTHDWIHSWFNNIHEP